MGIHHSSVAPNGCEGCDHRCDDCPDLEFQLNRAEYLEDPFDRFPEVRFTASSDEPDDELDLS